VPWQSGAIAFEVAAPAAMWVKTSSSTAMGVRILKTPVRAPKANAICERLVGTIRRECLDFLIPLGDRRLKPVLTNWSTYFNHARVTPV
jgi:transposase InsO family protein